MNRGKETFQYKEDYGKSKEGLRFEEEKLDIKVESRGQ